MEDYMLINLDGVELLVDYTYDPPTKGVRYDGSGGVAPWPGEVTVTSVEVEGVNITPLVEGRIAEIADIVKNKWD